MRFGLIPWLWLWLWPWLFAVGCTRPNPELNERCIPQGACGGGTYSVCSRDGCATRYRAGEAIFTCAGCTDCASALTQVTLYCAGVTNGGTNGGGGDNACALMSTRDLCVDCCINRHPDGYNQYITLVQSCVCVNPGACATDCAQSFCADINSNDTFCDLCLQDNLVAGGTCDITPGCRFNNPDCDKLLNCAAACPSQ